MSIEQPAHVRPPVLSRRWLATGGAVVLAGVIGVALMLQNSGSPACAAPPTGTDKHDGKATFYDLGNGLGNCSFPEAPDDDLYVALGNSEYSSAAACGSYLDVTGPKGKVRVKVIDRCPECEEGHLDLSRTAFKRIADEVQGIIGITYRAAIDPDVPGPLSLRFKDGTSEFFFAVLVDNHANPLRSVKVTSGGDTRTAKRADFNFWIIDGGAGRGPFDITMTDVYGNKATATDVKLKPEQTQKTSVRLTGGGGTAAVEAVAPDRAKTPSRRQRPPAAATKKPQAAGVLPASTPTSAAAPPVVAAAPSPVVPADTPLGVGPDLGSVLPTATGADGRAIDLAGATTSCR